MDWQEEAQHSVDNETMHAEMQREDERIEELTDETYGD